jgi:hypothetical protein
MAYDLHFGLWRFASLKQMLFIVFVKQRSYFFPASETCSLTLMKGKEKCQT